MHRLQRIKNALHDEIEYIGDLKAGKVDIEKVTGYAAILREALEQIQTIKESDYKEKDKRGRPLKRVIRYDKDGKWVTFDSLALAAKASNVRVSAISNVLKGRTKTAGGYKWIYKNN